MLLTVASTAPTTPRSTAHLRCGDGQWQCADGNCINATLRCDRKYHCRDGTDEFDCGKFDFMGSSILKMRLVCTNLVISPIHCSCFSVVFIDCQCRSSESCMLLYNVYYLKFMKGRSMTTRICLNLHLLSKQIYFNLMPA